MKTSKQPELKYFLVKVECSVPAVMHYKVLASSEEEAFKAADKVNPFKIDYSVTQKRKIKTIVIEYLTGIVKFMKRHF